MHDALLAAVAQQVTRAADNAAVMADAAKDLKESYRLSRRMKVLLVIGLTVIGLLLASNISLLFVSTSNHQIASSVKSCTDPNGKCYEQGQRSQASAVQLIIAQETRNVEIVTVCASSPAVVNKVNAYDDVKYLIAIEGCVAKLQDMQRVSPG